MGNIPSPSNCIQNEDDCGCDETPSIDAGDPSILFLEKSIESTETIDGKVSIKDISKALDEYQRLFKAGFSTPASAGAATAKFPFDGLTDEAKLTITVGT